VVTTVTNRGVAVTAVARIGLHRLSLAAAQRVKQGRPQGSRRDGQRRKQDQQIRSLKPLCARRERERRTQGQRTPYLERETPRRPTIVSGFKTTARISLEAVPHQPCRKSGASPCPGDRSYQSTNTPKLLRSNRDFVFEEAASMGGLRKSDIPSWRARWLEIVHSYDIDLTSHRDSAPLLLRGRRQRQMAHYHARMQSSRNTWSGAAPMMALTSWIMCA